MSYLKNMVIPYMFAREEEKNTIIVTKKRRREEKDTKIQSKKMWVVERTHSWMNRFRRYC